MLGSVALDVVIQTIHFNSIESFLDKQIDLFSTNTNNHYFSKELVLNWGLVPQPYLEGRATVDTCL